MCLAQGSGLRPAFLPLVSQEMLLLFWVLPGSDNPSFTATLPCSSRQPTHCCSFSLEHTSFSVQSNKLKLCHSKEHSELATLLLQLVHLQPKEDAACD